LGEDIQVETAVVETFEFGGREEAGVAGLLHEERVACALQNVSFRQFKGSVDVCQKIVDAY
jgi:hypothetical protein